MKFYKICKYKYSNENYKKEWSSIKQIKDFKTAREYIKTEKEYIKAIINFFNIYKKFKIEILEIYCKKNINKKILNKYKQTFLHEQNIKDLVYISKLFLREKIWCKFIVDYNKNAYICFGDNYYLLIGIDENVSIKNILLNTNLYYYDWHNVFE
ncbi:hypothetical protein [Aliarcobacter butzleri]|uniref:hypothetical protein n=1 Tax=Aliarcobacter butzleri TaxID=28197 RepID=UPI001EDA4AEA|nr:hypothetical protein [Aliarcobacter butzleri]MCG3657749.1 hypothetical protein [Aliarcobacter butzleri]